MLILNDFYIMGDSMKTKGDKSANVHVSSSARKAGPRSGSQCEELSNRVAEAAYYKAEARGFEPGHEIDDWLDAERELTCDSEPVQ
jgi:hypothetical protein